MKKILLILPLLIWLGCEDENDFEGFNEAWVECKQTYLNWSQESLQTEFSDYSYQSSTFEYQWDGLEVSVNGTDGTQSTQRFNEYGMMIESVHPQDNGETLVILNEYLDKWKLIKTLTISGVDTLGNQEYSWDGLFQSSFYDNTEKIRNTSLYNEYGRILENVSFDEDGDITQNIHYTYDEGWKLILSEWYGSSNEPVLVEEAQWEDNVQTFIRIDDDWKTEVDIIYNYYWKMTEYKLKMYRLNDNNEWIHNSSNNVNYEYECPGFEQIYP